MNTLKKIFNAIFSEGAFRVYCYFLIFISIVLAVDTGIKGDYSKMHNHLNWVIWIGLVVMYSLSREYEEIKAKSYKHYSEALEEHIEAGKALIKTQEEKSDLQKELIDKYEKCVEGLEKEISLLKKTQKASDKIIEQYKNNKESRF